MQAPVSQITRFLGTQLKRVHARSMHIHINTCCTHFYLHILGFHNIHVKHLDNDTTVSQDEHFPVYLTFFPQWLQALSPQTFGCLQKHIIYILLKSAGHNCAAAKKTSERREETRPGGLRPGENKWDDPFPPGVRTNQQPGRFGGSR